MGYNVVLSGESQQIIRTDISPPFSWSKNWPRNSSTYCPLYARLLSGLLLCPEDGDDIFSEMSVDFHRTA
jgi:hypothetical protein